jgi:hypothetical protein
VARGFNSKRMSRLNFSYVVVGLTGPAARHLHRPRLYNSSTKTHSKFVLKSWRGQPNHAGKRFRDFQNFATSCYRVARLRILSHSPLPARHTNKLYRSMGNRCRICTCGWRGSGSLHLQIFSSDVAGQRVSDTAPRRNLRGLVEPWKGGAKAT